MSDHPKIRQRVRPRSSNKTTVDPDVRGEDCQKLVEEALEAKLLEPKRKSTKAPANSEAGGDYAVGYKKPPVHSRFRKGQCPNPKGRPKKVKLSVEDQLAAMLDEQVTVTKDGKPQRMTTREVGLQRLVQTYMKGDMKAISLVTQWENKRALQKTASDGARGDPALEEPSAETLQLIANLKAETLRNASLSEEQIREVLTIFGLPPAEVTSQHFDGEAEQVNEADDNAYGNDDARAISGSRAKGRVRAGAGLSSQPHSNLGADR